MGRQSSRIFFQGKDHKDIYFQGHYHDKMYIGSTLVWEKLKSKLWVKKQTNIELFPSSQLKFGNGIFMAVGADKDGKKTLIRTSENGYKWEEYEYDTPFNNAANVSLHFVNGKFLLAGQGGIVTTQNGKSLSKLINVFTYNTLNYSGTLKAPSYNSCGLDMYISDNDYIYATLPPGSSPGTKAKFNSYYGAIVYKSSDGEIWNSINAKTASYTSTSGYTEEYLIADCFPDEYSLGYFILFNNNFYGNIENGKYGSVLPHPSEYENLMGYTTNFKTSTKIFDNGYFYARGMGTNRTVAAHQIENEFEYSIDFQSWSNDLINELIGESKYTVKSYGTLLRNSKYVLLADVSLTNNPNVLAIVMDKNINVLSAEELGTDCSHYANVAMGNGIILIDNYGENNKRTVMIMEDK